jgi:hypothetical protein
MMDNSASTNFIVTIRAAGERTEKLCYDTVANQAEGAEIVVIHEKPFKKALEECLRKGIESSKKWLITVDADMILLPGSIELMLNEADKMPSHYLQLQGKIVDKITGNIRKAGPRIYRTSLLPGLLSASEALEDHIRPESRLITAYGEEGYPSRYIPVVTCLHDYEQYYKDIYRKAYVHAHKHSDFLSGMIETAVGRQHTDKDYKVMLKAIWDGLTEQESVAIDTRLYEEKSKKALDFLELREKSEELQKVSEAESLTISDFLVPSLLKPQFVLEFHDQPKQPDLSEHKIKEVIMRRGLVNGIIQGLGTILIRCGKKLHSYTKNHF